MAERIQRSRAKGESCGSCRHFAPLSPDHAAICFHRWRNLPWNAAVPLTGADDWCDSHDALIELANAGPGDE